MIMPKTGRILVLNYGAHSRPWVAVIDHIHDHFTLCAKAQSFFGAVLVVLVQINGLCALSREELSLYFSME
jgi:hypothetical protein